MKSATLFHYFILSIFTYLGSLQAEGFTAHALIATPSGYVEIEQLQVGDKIISYTCFHAPAEYPIANITTSTTDCYIKISIGDEYICAAPGQKFYLYDHKKWIPAHKLQPADILMNNRRQGIYIDTVETVNEQCTVYLLSVNTTHTFCVSRHNIIAHNFTEAVVVPVITCAANFVITNAPMLVEVVKTAFASFAFLGAHLLQKRSEKKQKNILIEEQDSIANTNLNNNWQDLDDEKNKKHPNGIYKDAGYHHQNSNSRKSPAPKNGQACLDDSLAAGGNSTQRISIEENYFVVLKQTRYREFHGYCTTWDELHQSLRQVLIEHKWVKTSGKIIKKTILKASK